MSKTYISSSLRQAVAERAEHRCSYCLTPEEIIGAPFTVGAVIRLNANRKK